MTIDEAIAHAREKADKNSGCWKRCISIKDCKTCEQEHEQLAEWLEELKEARHCMEENRKAGYNHGFVDGYDKAIDDFAILMKETLNLAEQLKVGASNGTDNQ